LWIGEERGEVDINVEIAKESNKVQKTKMRLRKTKGKKMRERKVK
jgi:hypothetical protein